MGKVIHSLKVIIVFLYILLVVIPISLWGVLNVKLITKEVDRLLLENNSIIIQKQLDGFDDLYKKADEIAIQLMLDRNLMKEFSDYTGELDIDGVQRFNNIKFSIDNILIQHSEYSGIGLLSDAVRRAEDKKLKEEITAGYFGNMQSEEKPDWYTYTNYIFDIPCFIQYDGYQSVEDGAGTDMIFLIAYKNINTNRKLGTMCIKVPYKTIEKILSTDNKLGIQQIIFDEKGNIIYDTVENESVREAINEYHVYDVNHLVSYTCNIENQEYLILKESSSISRVSISYAIPRTSVFHVADQIQSLNMIIGALCLLFSVLLFFVIFYKILVPLAEIKKEMEKVENGNFEITIKNYGRNEIGKLAVGFRNMIQSILEKNHQIVEAEKRKREYEIKLLQSQINPHFLYNTLDSIKWIAVAQGEKTIEKMTHALIQLLRKTISDNKEFVRIEDEIENVTCYIEIQKLRYYDSFDFDVEMDESCKKAYIPRLTLQPLIENALFHGIYNCGRRGKISLVVKKEEAVVIEIIDNGRGMDIEEVMSRNKND
ncbi:MAG: sensor histidine kinase, partial [Oliverpabstia sp.]